MKPNMQYLIIGALAVVVCVVGFLYYQETQKTSGIEIKVNEGGITIEKQ